MTASPALPVEATNELEGRRGILGWAVFVAAVAIGLAIYFLGAEDIAARGTWFVVGETIGIGAAVAWAGRR